MRPAGATPRALPVHAIVRARPRRAVVVEVNAQALASYELSTRQLPRGQATAHVEVRRERVLAHARDELRIVSAALDEAARDVQAFGCSATVEPPTGRGRWDGR